MDDVSGDEGSSGELQPLGLIGIPGARPEAGSPALPHAMPASLAVEPRELLRMRESLYGGQKPSDQEKVGRRRPADDFFPPRLGDGGDLSRSGGVQPQV